MIKVFLVEDEYVIREGIKNNIDWTANGYEFVGEAGDGELAFPLIQKTKPDIVITDIRMPFMDGLTLSRMIKQKMPDTEIIVLTGHQDFEYAKESINIGVVEFLSKPISGEKLLEAINKVAEKVEKRNRQKFIEEQYIKENKEDEDKAKRTLFKELIDGNKQMAELLEMSSAIGVDLTAVSYCIMLMKIKTTSHASDEFSNRLVLIDERIRNWANPDKLLLFDRNLEGYAVILKGDSAEDIEMTQTSLINKIDEIIGDFNGVEYFIAVGEPVNRLSELSNSFEQASQPFAQRFLTSGNKVLYYKDMAIRAEIEDDFDIKTVDSATVDRNKVTEFLKTGDLSEVAYFVDAFKNSFSTSALESRMFRQYIAMDVYFTVVDFVQKLNQPKSEIEVVDMTKILADEGAELKEYALRILTQAIELRDSLSNNRYDDIVNDVMKFIDENYADEELSLNTLASHVNFSPNHLSMVFSQQTGQTFIKYLTEYRMNKAKELLKCTNKKSSVISEEVGYKDPHYFSYLFKKTQGVTPTQYRNGKE